MQRASCRAARPESGSNGADSEAAPSSSSSGNQQQQPLSAPAATDRGAGGSAGAGGGSSGGGGPERPPKSAEELEADELAEKMLAPAWEQLKRSLKKELPPDQASTLDQMTLKDATDGEAVMRGVAESQLGPLLQSVGSDEDPYAFFLTVIKIACALQLAFAAAVFYTCELGLGLDVGDSFRAVAGLGLGYFARIFIPIEQLFWPLYNNVLQLVSPNAVYDPGSTSSEERSKTLNSLGVAVAAAFLLPRYLLGWDTDDTLQIVLPMLCGLFLFDMAYLVALLYKLSDVGGDAGGGSGGRSGGGGA